MPSSLPQVGDGILLMALLYGTSTAGSFSAVDSRGNTYVLWNRNSLGANTTATLYCSQVATALQNGDTITLTQGQAATIVEFAAYRAIHVSAFDNGDDTAGSGAQAHAPAYALATNDELGFIACSTDATGQPFLDPDPVGYSKTGLTLLHISNGVDPDLYMQLWQLELVGLAGTYTPPLVQLNAASGYTVMGNAFTGSTGCVFTELGNSSGTSSGGNSVMTLVDTGGASQARRMGFINHSNPGIA